MGSGHYNEKSKNYGGLHTGDGKKQHTGVYSTGIRIDVESHNKFTVGTTVYHRKNGNKGIVISKNKKVPRSMIHVKFGNKTMYCRTNMIYREKHLENLRTKLINKGKPMKKKNKVTEKSKEKYNKFIEKKKKEETDRKIKSFKDIKNKLEFREAKKEFNELIKNGVTISFNDNNETVFCKAVPLIIKL